MKKTKNNEGFLSKLISEVIREKLIEFLINFEFTFSYGNNQYVFYVKEVELRNDLLKKFGIPLELEKGKVNEIKLTIQILNMNKPIHIEITGVRVDIKTIYLSQDYSKDYKTFKSRQLEDWERKNKEFLKNLNPESSILGNLVIDKLIPTKLEINDIVIRITDNVSSGPNKIKMIGLYIHKISSFGCDSNWDEISTATDEKTIHRVFNISKLYVNIYKDLNKREGEQSTETGNFNKYFIQPVSMNIKVMFPKYINEVDLKGSPQLSLEIQIDSAIVIDLKNSKLRFLIDFLSYLLKVKKVEKYWIHRPETKEENHSHAQAKEWFKYAFQVIRDELREKKRQTFDFASIMEKLIDMEKYIHLYKASHKLIIAPWIHKLDCEKDLTEMEEKMNLDDIICCREIAFTELITEGKTYCSSGEIGEGYKPLIHLWEYYVNDLRSKWINKSDSKTQIELSNKEKRDLMILSNLDKDKVLLSYIKGEQNHPLDQLLDLKINIKCLIVTFSRKLNNSEEVSTNLKFYKDIFNKKLSEEFKRSHIHDIINSISHDELKHVLNEENKNDSDNEEEDNNLNHNPKTSLLFNHKAIITKPVGKNSYSRMNSLFDTNSPKNNGKNSGNVSGDGTIQSNNSRSRYGAINSQHKSQIFDQNFSDSISVEYMDKPNIEDSISEVKQKARNSISKGKKGVQKTSKGTFKTSKTKQSYISSNGTCYFNKNFPCRKSIFSIVIGNINYNHNIRRNNKLTLKIEVNSFTFFDHNLTVVLLNKSPAIQMDVNKNIFEETKYFKPGTRIDYIGLVFNALYYEKNLSDLNKDLINKHLSYFLLETLQSYVNKNKNIFSNVFGLSEEFETSEFKFLSDYIFKFGFKKIKEVETGVIEELYFSLFISMIIEKNPELFKDKKELINEGNEKDTFRKLLDYYNLKKHVHNLNEPKFPNEKWNLMLQDLSYALRVVSVNMLKYVFSAIYPYFLNEKTMQKYFKKSMLAYVEELKNNHEKFFLDLRIDKDGKEYPNFIANEDSFISKKSEVKCGNASTEKCEINVKSRMNIKLSNETVAELMCVMPFITSFHSKNLNFAENIISDIKKSSFEIYENFRSLKAKWKAMQYLKTIKRNSDKSDETLYLNSKSKFIKDEIQIPLSAFFERINIKIIDKLYFITHEHISQIKVRLSQISIEDNSLERLPIIESHPYINFTYHKDKFDMNDIVSILIYTKISMKSIQVYIDDQKLVETNTKINIFRNLINNLPFFPDIIQDINIPSLNIRIIPSLIKVLKILSNMNYYKDLYDKNFNINSDIEKIMEEAETSQKEDARNTTTKVNHFKEKIERSLLKLLQNYKSKNPDKNKKVLYEYINNRQSTIINISIGKIDSDENVEKNGIFLSVSESDLIDLNKINNDTLNQKAYDSSRDEYLSEENKSNFFSDNIYLNNSSQKSEENKEGSIFTMRESLFVNNKQLWISEIKSNSDSKEKTSEKIKIKLNEISTQNKLSFNSVELVFNNFLIDSIQYFKPNKNNNNIIEEEQRPLILIPFSSNNYPFDESFSSTKSSELHNVFTQETFFYEDQDNFRNFYLEKFKIDPLIKEKFSSFDVNIQEISAKILFPPRSRFMNILYIMDYYSKMFEKTEKNRMHIMENESSIVKIKSRSSTFMNLIQKEKLHNQKINIYLSKLKLKLYNDISKKNDDFMFLLDIDDIQYHENMENQLDQESNITTLSQLNYNNINLVFSIPYKTKVPEDQSLLIKEIPPRDFSKIYERMSRDENKLLILNLRNINLKMMKIKNSYRIELLIGQLIKFGFLRRDKESYKFNNIPYNSIELISWIGSPKMLDNEKDQSLIFSEKDSKFQINDAEMNKLKDIASKANMDEKDDFKYALELTLTIEEIKRGFNVIEDDTLFPHLKRMIYEFKKFFAFKKGSKMKATFNMIHVEVSDSLFNYIFYFNNFLEEKTNIVKSKFIKTPEAKNYVSSSFLEECIDLNNHSSKSHKNKFVFVQDRNSGNIREIFTLDIPYILICLKQRTKMKDITFINLGLRKINGHFWINHVEVKPDVFQILVENVELKSYNTIYKNLILKNRHLSKEENSIFKFTINFNQKENKIISIENIIFIFLMKGIKEIIGFFDQNLEWMKQNPNRNDFNLLDEFTFHCESFLLKLEIKNTKVKVPEGSDSHNYLGVDIQSAFITIKEAKDIPKLISNLIDKLKIIDVKTVFNTKPYIPGKFETVPFSRVQIEGYNIEAYFFINNFNEKLGKINELKLLVNSPIVESKVFLLRKLIWEKNKLKIVSAQPSLTFAISGANINTSMSKLMSFKFFVKSNFNEKSEVVTDVYSNLDSIDFNFEIGKGSVGLDIFKFQENFTNKPIIKIEERLPSKKYAEIEFEFDKILKKK